MSYTGEQASFISANLPYAIAASGQTGLPVDYILGFGRHSLALKMGPLNAVGAGICTTRNQHNDLFNIPVDQHGINLLTGENNSDTFTISEIEIWDLIF